ncbi:DNAJ DOMAIN (PROKARYOTIC HEAT SHOCK PROTEIN)-RELATED [Salix koriyanagi]|uniref:DNAJ DOMAIN (PROKARYOTIC HEAT SHOCK PROTEIN)-RELATED n=1 Tax=Salix koriyanagi TaxID=2511006 RepID=A0A9Q0P3N9_9ROSI|nr:DNAJ DOMAIN (PROKARYOTIC HEAT SHOCK PROTEIN)-RELATED [Salix koriyanagi]
MAVTSSLASFSSSTSPFTGSNFCTNQPHTSPSRVSFRPFRVSAACASTAERPTSYTATLTSESSLYEVLGIQMGATCKEIKTAYRGLARILHPDVAGNGQREGTAYEFIRVHEAYETLSDPEKRADYDRSLYRRGRQMGSPFSMSAATATTMAAGYAAAGFSGRTRQRWETDQCW